MAFNSSQFQNITEKYGRYGGWAIWDFVRSRVLEASTDCVYSNISLLNSKHIIVGLNVSASINGNWRNFRGGKHDRKLKYAFNDTFLRGSYITDLYKDIIDPDSLSFHNKIKGEKEIIQQHVDSFVQEMSDIGANSETIYIVLGTEKSVTGNHFSRYFQSHFAKNKVIFHRHYSGRGTDESWVTSMWTALEIKDDFKETLDKYR
ncbi:MAG TPA: hypothetical protein PKO16_07135 [Bacteroidia bacterium]|nr:hypothetical protein [Bacteroidia bacterium]